MKRCHLIPTAPDRDAELAHNYPAEPARPPGPTAIPRPVVHENVAGTVALAIPPGYVGGPIAPKGSVRSRTAWSLSPDVIPKGLADAIRDG